MSLNRRHPTLHWAAALPVLIAFLAISAGPAGAQEFTKYRNYAEMTSAIQGLAGTYKSLARVSSIGRTLGGRDIWVLEIANPAGAPVKDRPALLVAGGFEGDHLVGGELALYTAAHLLKSYPADPEVKDRLDNAVVYVIPRVNPDGAEAMFAPVKTGRRTNARPFDDDNDGRVDEDGPEDLNKDGFITVMRVKAAGGEYMIDPAEPRLMKRADPKKGEAGGYKLYEEGIDNDKDGFINEDPPGGVDLNRNFMHAYPYYQADAGPHMASEAEARALLDWILTHRHIAAVLTFGHSDNLIVPPTSAGRLGPARGLDLVRFADAANAGARNVGMIQTAPAFGFGRRGMGEFSIEMLGQLMRGTTGTAQTETGGRPRMPARPPATTVNAADIDYFKAVSDKYIELTGIRQPLVVREPKGAFFEYAYYQFGVPAFSTPGFGTGPESPGQKRMPGMAAGAPETQGPPGAQAGRTGEMMSMMMSGGGQDILQMIQSGRRAGAAGAAPGEGPAAMAPGIDRQVLRWMDAEKIDGFVPWTKFNHPDLGEVEIGGFKPYAAVNPPAEKIAALGAAHAKFAVHLASLFPRVRIASTEVLNHGGGLFRIRAEIENSGFWPTALAQGVTARAVKPTMVQLGVDPGDIVSGNVKTEFFQALAGSGGRVKYEWIIRGKTGRVVELVASSQKGGRDSAKITLK
jgi:hypothetical protein